LTTQNIQRPPPQAPRWNCHWLVPCHRWATREKGNIFLILRTGPQPNTNRQQLVGGGGNKGLHMQSKELENHVNISHYGHAEDERKTHSIFVAK